MFGIEGGNRGSTAVPLLILSLGLGGSTLIVGLLPSKMPIKILFAKSLLL
jgi:hypothetical protein